MATQTADAVCDASSLANYQQWAQAISTALSTFGWTQTSDTGQIDWSTISSLPSSYGYQIWHPGDALQSSAPYFVRIEFYSDNSQNINIQIGTSTDGAGNLLGVTLNQNVTRYSGPGSQGSPTQYECDFSGDTGRFGAIMWRGNSNAAQFFGFERLLDSSGNPTATGVTFLGVGHDNANGSGLQQTLLFGSPNILALQYNSMIIILGAGSNGNLATTEALGNNVPWSPIFPAYGQYGNPHTIAGRCARYDVADGSTISVTLYGSTRTYLASQQNGLNYCAPCESNSTFLMRFD